MEDVSLSANAALISQAHEPRQAESFGRAQSAPINHYMGQYIWEHIQMGYCGLGARQDVAPPRNLGGEHPAACMDPIIRNDRLHASGTRTPTKEEGTHSPVPVTHE